MGPASQHDISHGSAYLTRIAPRWLLLFFAVPNIEIRSASENGILQRSRSSSCGRPSRSGGSDAFPNRSSDLCRFNGQRGAISTCHHLQSCHVRRWDEFCYMQTSGEILRTGRFSGCERRDVGIEAGRVPFRRRLKTSPSASCIDQY
jgi:hypothetical protein